MNERKRKSGQSPAGLEPVHRLYESMGDLDEDLLERSERNKRTSRRNAKERRKLMRIAVPAAAAMLAAVIGGSFILRSTGGPVPVNAAVIAQAEYPEMSPYPSGDLEGEDNYEELYDAWFADRRAQRDQAVPAEEAKAFFRESMQVFLEGRGEENRVCSPVNIFMAVAMLAELTDGESRQQILSCLGVDDLTALEAQAKGIWNGLYRDDGAVETILASSVWLNEEVSFVQETMDRLAENYYASSFRGKMGSEEFNGLLQNWLTEQTGGLLEETTKDISLNEQTIMAIAASLYYQAKWDVTFSEEATAPGAFHAPDGEKECLFMHRKETGGYYRGENFTAVYLWMRDGAGMLWLVLPDEGADAAELAGSREVMELIQSGGKDERIDYPIVNLALPKFDITSQMDLKESLRSLGIRDVLDPMVSDFSPMTGDSEGIAVSEARHDVRFAVDEEGVTAAAYTVMMLDGAGMPPDTVVDFTLDRPFFFALSSLDGLPLFAGLVYEP